MANPTIIFVPGAWHSPRIYSRTMQILESQGLPTVPIELPSIGAMPPHSTFDGDVDAIRQCVRRLVVEEGKEVIVACHSYGSVPSGEAVKGLSRAERDEEGLRGGVIRMVYIMAAAFTEGLSLFDGIGEFPGFMVLDDAGETFSVSREAARSIFYNDLSEEEADRWYVELKPQSAGVFHSKITFAAWRYIPSTYVLGMIDQTNVTPDLVNYMTKQPGPNAFDCVEICHDGGHCLMINNPEWLANVLRKAAGVKD